MNHGERIVALGQSQEYVFGPENHKKLADSGASPSAETLKDEAELSGAKMRRDHTQGSAPFAEYAQGSISYSCTSSPAAI